MTPFPPSKSIPSFALPSTVLHLADTSPSIPPSLWIGIDTVSSPSLNVKVALEKPSVPGSAC